MFSLRGFLSSLLSSISDADDSLCAEQCERIKRVCDYDKSEDVFTPRHFSLGVRQPGEKQVVKYNIPIASLIHSRNLSIDQVKVQFDLYIDNPENKNAGQDNDIQVSLTQRVFRKNVPARFEIIIKSQPATEAQAKIDNIYVDKTF